MKIFKKVREICIIGVGRFGAAIANKLLEDRTNKIRIALIDKDEKHLLPFKDEVDMIYVADCSEVKTAEALNIKDYDIVILASSDNIETAALLSDMKIKSIVARATSQRHAKVLKQIGVSIIISPEEEAGKRTAMLVSNPIISSYSNDIFELQDGFVTATIKAKNSAIIGKKISELDLRKKYSVSIALIKRGDRSYLPEGDFVIESGDVLSLIGDIDDVSDVIELF